MKKFLKGSWALILGMELNFIAGLVIGSSGEGSNASLVAGLVWFSLLGLWIWGKYHKVWEK
jgi:hypothetical protein